MDIHIFQQQCTEQEIHPGRGLCFGGLGLAGIALGEIGNHVGHVVSVSVADEPDRHLAQCHTVHDEFLTVTFARDAHRDTSGVQEQRGAPACRVGNA